MVICAVPSGFLNTCYKWINEFGKTIPQKTQNGALTIQSFMMLVKTEHGELPTKTKVFSMGSFNKHRLKIKIYQKCTEEKLENMRKH